MALSDKIKEIITAQGLDYTDKAHTIYSTCPKCQRSDKFSILKDNGKCVCYHGDCEFGRNVPFIDWIMQTANVTFQEARTMLYGEKVEKAIGPNDKLKLKLRDDPTIKEKPVRTIDEITPVPWPVYMSLQIDSPESKEGSDYLESRGIPVALAKYYGVMYSPFLRRVIFPIHVKGICFGWQGRAIDKVDKSLRMRNNDGFRRDCMVMFEDRLVGSEHAAILEGPVNALKFHLVGGNVSTLGKVVTQVQLQRILSYGVKALYVGLDLDAAKEIREIAKRAVIPVYHLLLPQSCIDRCKLQGKKPDFGECTFDECVWAKQNARLMGDDYLPMYLKSDEEILKALDRRNK